MNIVSKIADLFMPSQEVSSCDNFHLFKAEYRILETTIHQDYSQRVEELTNEVIANNLDIEIDFKFETCDSFTLLISQNIVVIFNKLKIKLTMLFNFQKLMIPLLFAFLLIKKSP